MHSPGDGRLRPGGEPARSAGVLMRGRCVQGECWANDCKQARWKWTLAPTHEWRDLFTREIPPRPITTWGVTRVAANLQASISADSACRCARFPGRVMWKLPVPSHVLAFELCVGNDFEFFALVLLRGGPRIHDLQWVYFKWRLDIGVMRWACWNCFPLCVAGSAKCLHASYQWKRALVLVLTKNVNPVSDPFIKQFRFCFVCSSICDGKWPLENQLATLVCEGLSIAQIPSFMNLSSPDNLSCLFLQRLWRAFVVFCCSVFNVGLANLRQKASFSRTCSLQVFLMDVLFRVFVF